MKNNKRGIGADKIKKYTKSVKEDSTAEGRVEKISNQITSKFCFTIIYEFVFFIKFLVGE